MPPSRKTHHLVLIFGIALVAMAAAHALTLGVGPASVYHHFALGPAGVLAGALLLIGIAGAFERILRSGGPPRGQDDWALPAFGAIRSIGPAKIVGMVLAFQFIALFASESLEQRVAGVAIGGIAGVFGSSLSIAPLVQLAFGVVAGLTLWLAAREICRHAAIVYRFVQASLAWISRRVVPVAIRRDRLVTGANRAHEKPIAFNLANRPPPVSVRIA
jgi:hypothetical protein